MNNKPKRKLKNPVTIIYNKRDKKIYLRLIRGKRVVHIAKENFNYGVSISLLVWNTYQRIKSNKLKRK